MTNYKCQRNAKIPTKKFLIFVIWALFGLRTLAFGIVSPMTIAFLEALDRWHPATLRPTD
jgi:hypothetical protein